MAGRGRFITIEGGEGGGKSTQVGLLAEALRAGGLEVVATREPGGAPGAEQIRRLLVEGEPGRWDPVAETLLHCAARRAHLIETVWPALDRGAWVVSDRFADSTTAYQGYGHGVDTAAIAALHRLVAGAFAPDLTILLDLPVAEGLARARRRGTAEDRYERMDPLFHQRLREGFLALCHDAPEHCAVVDASADIVTVHAAIRDLVRRRLGAPPP